MKKVNTSAWLGHCRVYFYVGSANVDAKYNSLAGRWFKKKIKASGDNSSELARNTVVETSTGMYRILSVYTKSYKKMRIVTSAKAEKDTVIHACEIKRDVFASGGLRCKDTYASFRGNAVKATFTTL